MSVLDSNQNEFTFANRYKIDRSLGSGGMAEVFHAYDVIRKKYAAIKVFHSDLLIHQEHIKRFKQQAGTLLELGEHKNIIKIYEIDELDQIPYIVMEYLDGLNLSQLLKTKKKLPFALILTILIQVCSAIEHIHQNNMIHGDIKPSNIFVSINTENGKPIAKVLDFEFAQIIGNTTARFGGTYHYMSPEQTGMIQRSVDHRSDLYSLGIVFFQLLTNQVPFTDEDNHKILYSHCAKKPPVPSSLNKKIPVIFDKIILKLLSKEANDRYQSIKGLQIDLINCLQDINYGNYHTDFEIGLYDLRGKINYNIDFIHRENEIQLLSEYFIESINDKGRIILLDMEDGLDRTNFPYTITNLVLKNNAFFLTTLFKPFSEQKDVFEPFIYLIKKFLKYLDTKSNNQRAEKLNKLKNCMSKDINYLFDYIPEIKDYFEINLDETGKNHTKTEVNKIIDVISTFLNTLEDKNEPLILVFNDIHYCDENTLRTLNYLIDKNHLTNNLLICSYDNKKIEEKSLLYKILTATSKQKYVKKIKIKPLDKKQTCSLIQSMLGENTKTTEIFSEKIYQRISGYPEIIKKTLKNLKKQKILFYDDIRGWQVDLNLLDTIPISKTGLDYVIKELDNLTFEEIKLASYIASLNYDFHFDLLYKIYLMVDNNTTDKNIIKTNLKEIFNLLINKQIIIHASYNNEYYKVIHSTIRELLYEQIKEIYRPVIHEQIAWVLKNEWEKNQNYITDIEFRLAYHFNRSQRIQKAMYANFKAGRKAKGLYNMKLALEFFLQSLECKEQWMAQNSSSIHNEIEHIKSSIHAIDERYMLDLFVSKAFKYKLDPNEKELINKRKQELELNQLSNDLISERDLYNSLIKKYEKDIKDAAISAHIVELERENRNLKQFESRIHGELVSIFRFKGDYHKAIEHLNKVLTLEDNHLRTIKALENIAICYFESGKKSKAINSFNDAIKLLNNKIPVSKTGLKLSYYKQRFLQFLHKKFTKFFTGKIAYKNISELHVTTIELCINLAFYYYKEDRQDITTYILIGLNLSERINNKEKLALLYSMYGYRHALKPMPETDTAFYYLEKGLNMAEEISKKKNFKSTLATCSRLIGMVCYFFNKIPMAIKHLERAIELYEELGNKWEIMHALRGLGLTYLSASLLDKVPPIVQKLGKIAGINGDKRESSWANILDAKYCFIRANPAKGTLNKAKENALTAFEKIKDEDDPIHIAIIEKIMGLIYLKEERYSNAMRYFKRCYERVNKEKLFIFEISDIFTLLAETIILSVSSGKSVKGELKLVKKLLKKGKKQIEIYPTLFPGYDKVRGMFNWFQNKENKAIRIWLDARKKLLKYETGKNNVYQKALLLLKAGLHLHEIANPRGIEFLQEAYLIFKDIGALHEYEILRHKLGFGTSLKDRGKINFDDKEDSSTSSTITNTTFTGTSNFSNLSSSKSYSNKISQMIGLKELDFIMGIGKEISGILNIDELTDKILEKALIVVTAERGFLLLYDKNKNLYIKSSTTGENPEDLINTISQTALKIVENSMNGLFVEDAQTDARYKLEPSVIKNNLRSIIAVPLISIDKKDKKANKKLLGILYLDNRMISALFEETDLEMLQYFAGIAAMGITTAKLVEERDKVVQSQAVLDVARDIQEGILPKHQTIQGYDISMKMHTATEVGGDYYDLFINKDNQRHWFSIGDVSGHGINSGLIMLMTQSMVSAVIRENPLSSPEKVLHTINAPIYENIVTRLNSYLYVVLTLGCFDDKGNFEVIGTQIPPVIYRAKTGKCEFIDLKGYLIGVLPKIPTKIKTTRFKLEQDDIVMFATDGAWEIFNPDIDKEKFSSEKELRKQGKFGMERLTNILVKNAHLSAQEIMKEIFFQVTKWGTVNDDITVILFKKESEKKKIIKVDFI